MAAKKKNSKTPPAMDATAPDLAEASAPPPEKAAKIASQEYEIRAVASIRLHPKNPKRGDVEEIGKSIAANDFYGAILVQKSSGFILAGNHRWKGAVEKGLKEVPVIVIDCDDETAERILLADNRIADLGTYDESALMKLVEERKAAGGLAGTGFVDMDLERMKAKLTAPSEFPSFDGNVTTKYSCPKCGFSWS